MKYHVTVDGRQFQIEIEPNHLVRVDGQPLYVQLEQVSGLPLYTLSLDEQAFVAFAEQGQDTILIELRGQSYPVAVTPALPEPRSESSCAEGELCSFPVTAPLPGRLICLPAPVGTSVEAGQVVAVVESMKMQMQLRAPRAGTVSAHHAQPGTDVAQADPLLTLELG
jgi:biotin carboxyl carrier protein